MSHVKMYTTLVCPYCVRAKALLKQRVLSRSKKFESTRTRPSATPWWR